MPTEYISLKYDLTPGVGSGESPLVIPVGASGRPCGRDSKQILISAQRYFVRVALTLPGAATMPGQVTASSNTTPQLDFLLPRELNRSASPDMDVPMTFSFSTKDPGNALICVIRSTGDDPFAKFDATFTCDGKADVANGQLTVTEGHIVATPCPA